MDASLSGSVRAEPPRAHHAIEALPACRTCSRASMDVACKHGPTYLPVCVLVCLLVRLLARARASALTCARACVCMYYACLGVLDMRTHCTLPPPLCRPWSNGPGPAGPQSHGRDAGLGHREGQRQSPAVGGHRAADIPMVVAVVYPTWPHRGCPAGLQPDGCCPPQRQQQGCGLAGTGSPIGGMVGMMPCMDSWADHVPC